MTSSAPSDLPTLADLWAAAARLAPVARRTPLLEAPGINDQLGGRLLVKAEVLQRTGSFKFRGAYNRISQIPPADRKRGVVAFSSGNHAQGVAHAAALLGCPATIVMPADAPAIKIRNTRGYGAKVVTYDRLKEDREAIGAKIAAETGATLVKPYDDPGVITGQGTVGLEIVQQCRELGVTPDQVIVPASGGGLIAGVSIALKAFHPACRIIVAEPAGYDDHTQSIAAGKPVSINPGAATLCDALMASAPGEITWAVNRNTLAAGVVLTDAEVKAAIRRAFLDLKIVVEPGGAVSLAGMLSGKVPGKDKTTIVVASGGNVDPVLFASILAETD